MVVGKGMVVVVLVVWTYGGFNAFLNASTERPTGEEIVDLMQYSVSGWLLSAKVSSNKFFIPTIIVHAECNARRA